MKLSVIATAAVLAVGLLGEVAHAQQVVKGVLTGTLVQATATLGQCNLPPPNTCPEQDLITAPADKFLIVTQVCGYGVLVGPNGRMGGFASGGQCTRFDPGLVIDKGSTLKCYGSGPCTIVGVLSK